MGFCLELGMVEIIVYVGMLEIIVCALKIKANK